jgi:hypothetical protein
MTLDVALLERSFDLVAPRGQELVDRFFEWLFVTAPATMPSPANEEVCTRPRLAHCGLTGRGAA